MAGYYKFFDIIVPVDKTITNELIELLALAAHYKKSKFSYAFSEPTNKEHKQTEVDSKLLKKILTSNQFRHFEQLVGEYAFQHQVTLKQSLNVRSTPIRAVLDTNHAHLMGFWTAINFHEQYQGEKHLPLDEQEAYLDNTNQYIITRLRKCNPKDETNIKLYLAEYWHARRIALTHMSEQQKFNQQHNPQPEISNKKLNLRIIIITLGLTFTTIAVGQFMYSSKYSAIHKTKEGETIKIYKETIKIKPLNPQKTEEPAPKNNEELNQFLEKVGL